MVTRNEIRIGFEEDFLINSSRAKMNEKRNKCWREQKTKRKRQKKKWTFEARKMKKKKMTLRFEILQRQRCRLKKKTLKRTFGKHDKPVSCSLAHSSAKGERRKNRYLPMLKKRAHISLSLPPFLAHFFFFRPTQIHVRNAYTHNETNLEAKLRTHKLSYVGNTQSHTHTHTEPMEAKKKKAKMPKMAYHRSRSKPLKEATVCADCINSIYGRNH